MSILGDISSSSGSSESWNNGFGIGLNSGQSYEEGGSSYGGFGDSSSSSYYHVYGSEASAKDIERAKEANELTEKWMDKNLAFQEYMSNTAYQRAIKDLMKAGLNPYLAATHLGGASTPQGAMATAAKAQTYPDIDSGSESSSHSENSGSSYNFGGSSQYGVNINLNSGKSYSSNESKSEPFVKWLGDEFEKGLNSKISKIRGY